MDANPQQWQLAPTGIRSKQISDVIDEIYFKLIYFSASTTCLLSFLL